MAQPQWAQPPQRQGTNGLAIAGFVLALLWLCTIGSILGIIFGFVALAQIRSSQQGGRGLAIAGIVLGIVGILATVAVAIIAAYAAEDLLDEVAGERDDVTITACAPSADGDAAAELTILNDSSKRSDYFVIVRFEAGDESVEVEFDGVERVEPGETVVRTVSADESLPDGYDCVLQYVQRTATSTSEGD
jgi:hypothetical protein